MTSTTVLAVIFCSAILWTGYFYYKDRRRPEPWYLMVLTFAMGIVSGLLCFHAFKLLPLLGIPADASIMMDQNRFGFFWYSIGAVGLVEELLKFLPFLLIIHSFRAFDEKVDGIIYAALLALGFAAYENYHYLSLLEGWELYGRAIASPITHCLFAAIWGYFVGTAKLTGKSLIKASIIGLTLSAITHGLFDFFTTSPTLRLIAAAIILIIWIWKIKKIDTLTKHDHHFHTTRQNLKCQNNICLKLLRQSPN